MPAKPAVSALPPLHEGGDPIFVTATEAARLLSLSQMQVYRLLDAQLIEGRYYGKRRLVVLDSLRRFAEDLPSVRAG